MDFGIDYIDRKCPVCDNFVPYDEYTETNNGQVWHKDCYRQFSALRQQGYCPDDIRMILLCGLQ